LCDGIVHGAWLPIKAIIMRYLFFFLSLFICDTNKKLYAQTSDCGHLDQLLALIAADQFARTYYVAIPVEYNPTVGNYIFLKNAELHDILSKRFPNYRSYTRVLCATICSNQPLHLTKKEYDHLKDKFCDYREPIFKGENVDSLIDTYFDNSFLKPQYDVNQKDTRRIMVYLFKNGIWSREDDITGLIQLNK